MRNRIALSALMPAALIACAPEAREAAATLDADTAAINEVRRQEVAGINGGDTLLAYLADDIVMLPPDEPIVVGLSAVREWSRSMMEQMRPSVAYMETDVIVSGDWAIERYAGTVTLRPASGGSMEGAIKGIHVYRRGPDGTWKLAQDIWNASSVRPTTGH